MQEEMRKRTLARQQVRIKYILRGITLFGAIQIEKLFQK